MICQQNYLRGLVQFMFGVCVCIEFYHNFCDSDV